MKILKLINKFNSSPKGQVAKSIFCLLFSLILVVTATFAWIASNVTTTSGGMSVGVLDGGSYARYSAFYVDDINNKTIGKKGQEVISNAEGLHFGLRTYDKTFTAVNAYARVVVRIEVYNIDAGSIPQGNGTKHLNVLLSRNSALDPDTTSSKLGGVFSSIGQVGCYTSSALTYSDANATIYNTIVNSYVSANNAQTFTTVTNNVVSKQNTLSIDVAYSRSDIKTGENNKDCLFVYVVFDYITDLTNLYITQNEASLAGSSGDANVLNDLSKIDVDFV